jgi:hypothetical protein
MPFAEEVLRHEAMAADDPLDVQIQKYKKHFHQYVKALWFLI